MAWQIIAISLRQKNANSISWNVSILHQICIGMAMHNNNLLRIGIRTNGIVCTMVWSVLWSLFQLYLLIGHNLYVLKRSTHTQAYTKKQNIYIWNGTNH